MQLVLINLFKNNVNNVLSTWITRWREKITWLQTLEGLRTTSTKRVSGQLWHEKRGPMAIYTAGQHILSAISSLSPGYKLTRRATTRVRCPLRYFCIYAPITQSPECSAVFRRENAVRCNELPVKKDLWKINSWLINSFMKNKFIYTNFFYRYYCSIIYSLLITLLTCSFHFEYFTLSTILPHMREKDIILLV